MARLPLVSVDGVPVPLMELRGRRVTEDCLGECGGRALVVAKRMVPGLGYLCAACFYSHCITCGHHERSHPTNSEARDLDPRWGALMAPHWRPCRYCDCTDFTRARTAEEAWALLLEKRPALATVDKPEGSR